MIRSLVYIPLAALVGALLMWLILPSEELPEELAIGTVVIPPEFYAKELKDVGEVTGLEKATRKAVKPRVSAVAPGAAEPVLSPFIAAVEARVELRDSTGSVADTVVATRCVGLGGSVDERRSLFQRQTELVLYGGCSNGDGTRNRYRGREPAWSYETGRETVNVARWPDFLSWVEWALFFAAGFLSGRI